MLAQAQMCLTCGQLYICRGVYYGYDTNKNTMWVRRIGQKGTSESVTLPTELMRALGWERGDHVYVQLYGNASVIFTKFDRAHVSDKVGEALDPISEIHV